jgi:ABC-type uncharacterized transport system substrate-binding protein
MRALRRLLLGLALIAAAATMLVLTDQSRSPGGGAAARRIAIIQLSSIKALEDGARGAARSLERAGFSAEGGSVVDRFNAEGDIGTLNQIVSEVDSRGYDVVVTISTPVTQAFMRANRRGVPTVLGVVSSPPSLGVAYGEWTEGARPRWITGLGSLQPVGRLFELAKRANPSLKRIGAVWNPAEPNAEANVKLGREVAARLGMEIVEANASNPTEVLQAAATVMARDIDVMWLLADTNVIAASKPLIAAAKARGIAVITNNPGPEARGAVLSIGADFRRVGELTGDIAVEVLRGRAPDTIPVEPCMPEVTEVDHEAGAAIGPQWSGLAAIANEISAGSASAGESRDSGAVPAAMVSRTEAAVASGAPVQAKRVAVVTYAETPPTEDALAGTIAGLADAGFSDGTSMRLSVRSAQLDTGTMNAIMAQVAEERPDLLLTFSTPTLQAAMRRMRGVPVVFNLVASPEAAKVCTTPHDHLPGFTGVSSASDYDALARALREAFPAARTAGGIFCPSEVNSEYNRVEMARALAAVGIEYQPMPADRPSDVPAALDAAIARRPDALIALSDNLSSTAMPAVLKAASGARVPLVGFVSDLAEGGALFVLARDFRELGLQGGAMAARVLRGESADTMPIELPHTTRLIVNETAARTLGITLPPAMVARADQVIGPGAPSAAPAARVVPMEGR